MASRYTPIVPSAAALATLATVLALAPGAAPSGARPPGRLAVVGDGTLYVIQASDGRKRIVYPLAVSSAAWSRDGRLAYVADGAVRAGDRWSRVVASLGARFSVGVSWAPDGRRLVYAFHPAVAATARLVVARRDGGRPRIIDTRVSAYQVPQWSPRGNAIAYLRSSSSGAAIWLVRPDGRGRRLVQRGVADDGTSVAWSPDGTQLAFVHAAAGSSQRALSVVRADGAKRRTLASAGGGDDIGDVHWSPRDDAIAYLRSPDVSAATTELCLAYASGASGRVVVRAPFIDELAWSPDGRWLAYITEDPNEPSGVPMSVWIARADGSSSRIVARFDEPAYGLAWGR